MPLRNLKLCCSTEGKSTPGHDGRDREHLRWHLLAMPLTLGPMRTIKVTFFLNRESNFLPLLNVPTFKCSLAKSKWALLWCWSKGGLWRRVFEAFPSPMLSGGYWAAASTSDAFNVGQGSSPCLDGLLFGSTTWLFFPWPSGSFKEFKMTVTT